MVTWCNGEWIDGARQGVSPADRGFLLGDGLFETILWDGGALRRFERHMHRLHSSAAALHLPEPPGGEALSALSRDVLKRNGLHTQRAAVRITWSAGVGARGLPRPDEIAPTLAISAAPSVKAAEPAALITSTIPRNASAPSARHKTLSYIDNVMARGEAAAAGADEALMLNGAGNLAGGAASNVFLMIGGVLLTPDIAEGALPGTVREALLAAAPGIALATITRGEIARAEAFFITNALQEIRLVSRVDGRALDQAHPDIDDLRRALPL